jgi:hypothetical protein
LGPDHPDHSSTPPWESFRCRYIAVHNPIDYNQSMNDAGAIKRRLFKYLLPVLAASILFNLPKFFEATFVKATRVVSSRFFLGWFNFLLHITYNYIYLQIAILRLQMLVVIFFLA